MTTCTGVIEIWWHFWLKMFKNGSAAAYLLFAGLTDIGDVWEEVVVFRLGHRFTELGRVLEHADQDLQTVQVRVLWRDHLENGLMRSETQTGKWRQLVVYYQRVTLISFRYPTNYWLTRYSMRMDVCPIPALYYCNAIQLPINLIF